MKKILIICLMFILVLTPSITSAENMSSIHSLNKSTWEWNSAKIKDKTYINSLKSNNVNRVFMYANRSYLSANVKHYNRFISNANTYGIRVNSLLGDPSYGTKSGLTALKSEVATTLTYNKKYAHDFDAVHLDIEPYLNVGWEGNESQYLEQYLSNLKEVRNQINQHNNTNRDDIKLVIDLPLWIYQFDANGQAFLPQVFDIVDEVGIMAYTHYNDYYISGSVEFLKVAKEKGKKVNIGSEFQSDYADVSLSSFDKNTSETYLLNGLKTFNTYSSFNGLSVHTFQAYKDYMLR